MDNAMQTEAKLGMGADEALRRGDLLIMDHRWLEGELEILETAARQFRECAQGCPGSVLALYEAFDMVSDLRSEHEAREHEMRMDGKQGWSEKDAREMAKQDKLALASAFKLRELATLDAQGADESARRSMAVSSVMDWIGATRAHMQLEEKYFPAPRMVYGKPGPKVWDPLAASAVPGESA